MSQTQTQYRNALTTTAFLAAVWAVAAAFQPTSTYHLAPLLVAALLPALAGANSKAALASTAAQGAAIAAGAAVVLAAFDLLRGPTLLPYGGALAEAATFAAIGAAGGALIAIVTALSRRTSAA
jgi:hypothetical protein